MTFVGKILVIVIMVFALFFLALTTVAFTTTVNWKAEVTKVNDQKKKLSDEKGRLENNVKDAEARLALAKDEAAKAAKDFESKLKDIESQNTARGNEIQGYRGAAEVAIQEVKKAQDEAEARIKEAAVLRDNLKKVQDQRDEFLLQKTDLNQQIAILKRELDTATSKNKDLRDRTAVLSAALRKNGLPADAASYSKVEAPPEDVEGRVLRVDPSGQVIEISIGKDDGLVAGHELVVYRTTPAPDYIGKVQIISVDPDRASARVVGKTYLGKKIQEGDSVSTSIRPRG